MIELEGKTHIPYLKVRGISRLEAKRVEKDMYEVCNKNKKNTAYIDCGHFNQIEISQ